MRKTPICIAMGCCLLAVALIAWAQSARRPGLWEVTTTMSMGGRQMPQMPQLPPGVTLPPGVQLPSQGSPFGGPTTTQVCVTQAMIDRYGGAAPAPPNRNADCKITDISIQSSGMTAKINCTGQMTANGTVESTFVDANTTKTKMHMTGTMQRGSNSMPVDMTMQSSSVYKSADCGSVRPMPLPQN